MAGFLLGCERERLALDARRLVEGCAQSPGKFQGVFIGPEVKEKEAGLLVQHVAVECGHVDSVRAQT
jgi:hypothetical protein